MWFRRIFRADPRSSLRKPAGAASHPGAALSSGALRQLDRLQLAAGRLVPGGLTGERASPRRRPSSDFRDHRTYAPGDDVRFVDWRASARQEHVFIRQGEQPKDASVYVLVDCSASMAWGSPPKREAALLLAQAFGYLALAHGDRLKIVPLTSNGKLRPLGPISGKGQFAGLINYLRALPFSGQVDPARALVEFSRSHSGRNGLVVLLSDLLGAGDLAGGLRALPLPTWNVAICHLLHPQELEPGVRGDLELRDVETGQRERRTITDKSAETYQRRLQTWLDNVQATCSAKKSLYTLIPTGWSMETQILPHLRSIQMVKPL